MMQNMKTLKTTFLASCIMVTILIGLNINGIIKTFLHAVQVDRQIYGQFRRWLVKTPNTDFKHKYETPYFRQFNLNTRTDKLEVCSWLKGKFARVIAKYSNNSGSFLQDDTDLLFFCRVHATLQHTLLVCRSVSGYDKVPKHASIACRQLADFVGRE